MKPFQKWTAALLPLLFVAAGVNWSTAMTDDAGPIACAIRGIESSDGLRLEAVVTAKQRAKGAFELVVSTRGSGGTSDVTQAGDFDVGGGEELAVGEVSVGSGPAISVRARMTVTSDRGAASCEEVFPRRS